MKLFQKSFTKFQKSCSTKLIEYKVFKNEFIKIIMIMREHIQTLQTGSKKWQYRIETLLEIYTILL